MKLKNFVTCMQQDLSMFQKNIETATKTAWLARTDRTNEEWMDCFLRWMEWHTDMHDSYWK